ncbi:MAG: pyridoxamine 5'-phosphate oxidase [Rhodobacteraceae bacterium]|nr:MAG: pyridoxamine 5'-phosphate oxidase [Paracoccaceae bacterium]
MSADPHPWARTLEGLHAQAWARLGRGVHDRHATARHPTLATVSAEGRPQARTVVLRGVERGSATLQVYTDLQSAKVAELRASPFAAVHVWDSGAHLQIRLQAEVTILSGVASAAIWAQLPQHGRSAYGSAPAPGAPVPAALDYSKTPDPSAFAILSLAVTEVDLLHLGTDHRRARFRRASGWSGEWLVP